MAEKDPAQVEDSVVDDGPQPYEPATKDDTGSATLDFFLGSEPEVDVYKDIEVKRIGLLFRLHNLGVETINAMMTRSEKKQTGVQRRTGRAPERDQDELAVYLIVAACDGVAKRLMTDEEARENLVTISVDGEEVPYPYGEWIKITDDRLLSRHGPRPDDWLRKWTLPGERALLAGVVTELAGYDEDALIDPIGSAKNS